MKSSIVTKIIAIFVLFGIFPMLFFTYLYTVNQKQENQKMLKESLSQLVKQKGEILLLNLEKVENEVTGLSEWIENYYQVLESSELDALKSTEVSFDQAGFLEEVDSLKEVIDKKIDTGFYIPNMACITKDVYREIKAMHSIESSIIRSQRRLENLEWVYYISCEDTMILSPKADLTGFGIDHRFEEDIYYSIAMNISPKEAKVVWTEPYFDWLGKGWTITCSRPIFYNGTLRGVVCADVSLDNIQLMISDFKLSGIGFAFLIDRNGNVIYHPAASKISKTKGQLLSMNLLSKNHEAKYLDILQQMISNDKGVDTYNDIAKKKIKAIAYTSLSDIHWVLGIEANLQSYQYHYGISQNYMLSFIVPLVFTFMIMGIYLFFTISRPLVHLSGIANTIREGNYAVEIQQNSNDEIGVLENAFKQMVHSILKNKLELEEKNIEINAIFNSFPGDLYLVDNQYQLKLINRYRDYGLKDKKLSTQCYKLLYDQDTPCDFCPLHNKICDEERLVQVSINNQVYQIRSYPVKAKRSEISGWVLFKTDITERYILEKKMRQSEKLAGVGQTVAGVTHELRNPLTVIKGATHLIKRSVGECQDTKLIFSVEPLLSQIDASTKDAEMTINNILEFSKPSFEEKACVDLIKISHQTLLLEKHIIVKKGITTEIHTSKPSITLCVNKDAIKHIFLNLISNALYAAPEKTGKLAIVFNENLDFVSVKFIDNGLGISKDVSEKVFEPFFSTKKDEGTGLGLWIVKKELEKMNANIVYNRNIKGFTEFKITFRKNNFGFK